MKLFRGLYCLPVILIFFLRHKFTFSNNSFWNNSIGYFRKTRNLCLGKWLLISAISETSPNQILEIYSLLDSKIEGMRLTKRTAMAIFESAIWMKDKDAADSLRAVLDVVKPTLSEGSLNYINLLYLWRFSDSPQDVVGVQGLLSPHIPHDEVIPYVGKFAKATIADKLQKNDEALRLYKESLRSIPNDSHEYKYAMERCNYLLNIS